MTFCSVKSYFVSTTQHTHENHRQQLCCKWLRHILWGQPLKFQGLTRREWVIQVGPKFYLILDQNDQAISFSILYDLLLYLSQHAIPFPLRRSLDHFFSSQLPHPTPPQQNILHGFNSPPTYVQPEDHQYSQSHWSDISKSSQKRKKAQAHCINHTNRFN